MRCATGSLVSIHATNTIVDINLMTCSEAQWIPVHACPSLAGSSWTDKAKNHCNESPALVQPSEAATCIIGALAACCRSMESTEARDIFPPPDCWLPHFELHLEHSLTNLITWLPAPLLHCRSAWGSKGQARRVPARLRVAVRGRGCGRWLFPDHPRIARAATRKQSRQNSFTTKNLRCAKASRTASRTKTHPTFSLLGSHPRTSIKRTSEPSHNNRFFLAAIHEQQASVLARISDRDFLTTRITNTSPRRQHLCRNPSLESFLCGRHPTRASPSNCPASGFVLPANAPAPCHTAGIPPLAPPAVVRVSWTSLYPHKGLHERHHQLSP